MKSEGFFLGLSSSSPIGCEAVAASEPPQKKRAGAEEQEEQDEEEEDEEASVEVSKILSRSDTYSSDLSVTEQLIYLAVRSKYDVHLSIENDHKVKILKKETRFLRDALERKATD